MFIPADENVTSFFFNYNMESDIWVKYGVNESEKFKRVKRILIDSAEDAIEIKVKEWYQVYTPDFKAYGFSVVDGRIKDHPNRQFEGLPFDLSKAKFEVVKITEQWLI